MSEAVKIEFTDEDLASKPVLTRVAQKKPIYTMGNAPTHIDEKVSFGGMFRLTGSGFVKLCAVAAHSSLTESYCFELPCLDVTFKYKGEIATVQGVELLSDSVGMSKIDVETEDLLYIATGQTDWVKEEA